MAEYIYLVARIIIVFSRPPSVNHFTVYQKCHSVLLYLYFYSYAFIAFITNIFGSRLIRSIGESFALFSHLNMDKKICIQRYRSLKLLTVKTHNIFDFTCLLWIRLFNNGLCIKYKFRPKLTKELLKRGNVR